MKNNSFKSRAFLPFDGVENCSDIESVKFEDGALVATVACTLDQSSNVKGITVRFPDVTGFRLLDELDWLATGRQVILLEAAIF